MAHTMHFVLIQEPSAVLEIVVSLMFRASSHLIDVRKQLELESSTSTRIRFFVGIVYQIILCLHKTMYLQCELKYIYVL